MTKRNYLSGILALAMIVNACAIPVSAAEQPQTERTVGQVMSSIEKVYVNSYGGRERSASFNENWRFQMGDANGAEAVNYDDSAWKRVTVPHDYSIVQGFTDAAPAEQESGYVLGGTGWYRKSFVLDAGVEGKNVSIDFDGVYMNATIYLNGTRLGMHPYGYTPFSFVLPAELLKYNGEENIVAVKVEHVQPSSRWYSGSGIYRDVKLTITNAVHIAHFGTAVTTPDIQKGKGTVAVSAEVQNDTAEEKNISVQQVVYELDGKEPVVTGKKTEAQKIEAGATVKIEDTVEVANPKLWSTETPNLYMVRTNVYDGEELVDSYDSNFGFRWITFTNENGFFLNGKNMKLKGVCMHHDQGALGSKAYYHAIERQVQILKDMGVNAIRTTHNPSSSVMIDVCNRNGMMLIEEAFDCWIYCKNGNFNDYSKWFSTEIDEDNAIVGKEGCDRWPEFDIKAMIRRGRNNPSIIMFSLGNEVFESIWGSGEHYPEVAEELLQWASEEDTSRYITIGDNKAKANVQDALNTVKKVAEKAKDYGFLGGVIGYNYGSEEEFVKANENGWIIYGSEAASSVNSRGIYDRKDSCGDGWRGDKRLTSYDQSRVSWGHLASEALWITQRQAFNAGEFVWTGFDYIGEPTPWNNQGSSKDNDWPVAAKNAYFGIIDTNGFPKDSYYLYQSQWNDDVTTLHLLPVWEEKEIMIDRQGKVEVVVYSDAPVVKLYLNGEEIGSATAEKKDTPTGGYQCYNTGTGCFAKGSGPSSLFATFNVPYEAGKIEAKAFQADGKTEITETEGRSSAETPKAAAKLAAEADRTEIKADGTDVSYVTIDVQDADGKFVNSAEPEITVSVEGDGRLLGLDNGVQADVTAYGNPSRKAGKGKLLAIVQSTKDAGEFTVTASAEGFADATVKIQTKKENNAAEKNIIGYEIARNYYIKEGVTPQLPESIKIFYSDDTSEVKKVQWAEFPADQKQYTVFGEVEDSNLRVPVNVMIIGEGSRVLNYSAAIGKDAALRLPDSRPVVAADGTVLLAEFPVVWNVPENVTASLGTKVISGTATVFDETMEVTASVRVTNGSYVDGGNRFPSAAEFYLNGSSSETDSTSAEIFQKLQDGKTSKDDAAWSGKNQTLDVRFDTAIGLKSFVFYIKDTAPLSSTIKVYSSGDNGATWKEAECTVTNKREDGMTVRTYTLPTLVSETMYRMEFTKKTVLSEIEMNVQSPTFPIGEEAKLSWLEIGGHAADAATLEKGFYGVADTSLTAEDVTAVGKDNASVTVLDKDKDNTIRMLLESEDHTVCEGYEIRLGKENTGSADDDGHDYAYGDMTLRAASADPVDPIEHANDNDPKTIWHSRWSWGDINDLSQLPERRYVEMELKEVEKVNGIRYLPRNSGVNGDITQYRVEISTDGEEWKVVANGNWNTDYEWKLAEFDAADAKYLRLYGELTASTDGIENQYISAAEVRVRLSAKELYADNTTVTLRAGDQSVVRTGKPITPEPTVVYSETGKTLVKDTDYTVAYEDNTEPGTASVIITGKGIYTGAVKTTFTITDADVEIIGYETLKVFTESGERPVLPGTVLAHTNMGDKYVDVLWDQIGDSAFAGTGSFRVYGTVTDTDDRVAAIVVINDVIGVQQVTMSVEKGTTPELPEKVTVYYSNGDSVLRDVTWNLAGLNFDAAGTVEVKGTAGSMEAVAVVRVLEEGESTGSTPEKVNLALNKNGEENPTKWPRTFSYIGSEDNICYHATNGSKTFVNDGSKVIWCDWENNVFHTNSSTDDPGADNRLPFLVTAFGKDGSTDDADQMKYTVNKASIGFMDEYVTWGGSKVCLPAGYKIEYYSANDGVIDASQLNNTEALKCSNVREWDNSNPLKSFSDWTEVEYIEKAAIPTEDTFRKMVDVYFKPVQTTAIRITLTPRNSNWTGLEEFEVYYEPEEQTDGYEVEAINLNGTNVLNQFDENKTLNVNAAEGTITASATDNASVTVLQAVAGEAKIIFMPENGDESKKQIYTIHFTAPAEEAAHEVAAADELVVLQTGKAETGETITFAAEDGYMFKNTPVIVKSKDHASTDIQVVEKDGNYSFTMPEYAVTIEGEMAPAVYQITYDLDGGTVEGNPETYTIETPDFTLKNPTKKDHIFLGWTSGDVTEPVLKWKVAAGTTGDLTFTAKWSAGTVYQITFESNGGTAIAPQEVSYESGIISEPAAPTKKGYAFGGWYTDEECKTAWNFAEDRAIGNMTLYAKWTEQKVTVKTELPVCGMDQPYELPEKLQVSVGSETFETAVQWNDADVTALNEATEVGVYTVKGTLGGLDGREISVEIVKSPVNIVYFADCGANQFTQKGQILVEANAATIKNQTPDQAYTAESGWGYTNPANMLETHTTGAGDAYDTIRNFRSGKVTGKNGETLTYQFALEKGTYDVVAGLCDIWGHERPSRVSVTKSDKSVLGSTEFTITGAKKTVSFTDVSLTADDDVSVNVTPLNTDAGDDGDIMASFIVIIRKPDVPETNTEWKARLRTAIDLASDLKEEDYTAESFRKLTDTIAEAEVLYQTEAPEKEAVLAQIDAIGAAIRELQSAYKDEKERLEAELAGLQKQLDDKTKELEEANETISGLRTELTEKDAEVTELNARIHELEERLVKDTEDMENLTSQIAGLTEEKAAAEAKADELKAELAKLEAERDDLQAKADTLVITLQKEQDVYNKLLTEKEASDKAALEALKLAEENRKKLEEALNGNGLKNGDTVRKNGIIYRVTDAEQKFAEACGVTKKSLKKVKVAATVKVKNVTCKVTGIADGAFSKMKKLKKAVIGKNVVTIGANAFKGSKNLKNIKIAGKQLKYVGKSALRSISKGAVIKTPKTKRKAYRRLFKGKGASSYKIK